MFTKQELITLLESKGAVNIFFPVPVSENRGLKIHKVTYREDIDEDIISESSEFFIAEVVEGVPADGETPAVEAQFKYHKGKPDILKEEVAPPRSQHFPDSALKSQFETRFTNQKVKSLRVEIDGGDDIVYIEANDTVENILKNHRIKVWKPETGPAQWQIT